jgi:hypothetical protein
VSEDSSFLVKIVEAFVIIVVVMAFLGLSQFIPPVTNMFVFLLVDNVKGLVAGAIVFGLLGTIATKEVKVGGFTFTIGAVLGAMLQYYLFH